jgi:endo-1,4-beta-D-glucanase Y
VGTKGEIIRFAGARYVAVRVFALLFLLLAVAPGFVRAATDWDQFLRDHTHADGRVLDGAISHSEGQGVGMLLAVHFADRAAFDRMWQWTHRNLMVRDDGLLAWRWSEQKGVTDRNNATDGDLLVAWALVRAAERWNSSEYRTAGSSLARSVREKLVRSTPRGIVLLPGAEGFEKNGNVIVNLSYWIFPAFPDLARADPSPVWPELAESGRRLLAEVRFGRWGLPPDWLQVGKKLGLPQDREARFSYDAIRIPLYLMWSGAPEGTIRPFRSFWAYFRGAQFLPAWTRLNDDSVDSHDALKGVRAIAAAVDAYPALDKAQLPGSGPSEPYYSDALLMLTKVMLWERAGR